MRPGHRPALWSLIFFLAISNLRSHRQRRIIIFAVDGSSFPKITDDRNIVPKHRGRNLTYTRNAVGNHVQYWTGFLERHFGFTRRYHVAGSNGRIPFRSGNAFYVTVRQRIARNDARDSTSVFVTWWPDRGTKIVGALLLDHVFINGVVEVLESIINTAMSNDRNNAEFVRIQRMA